MKFYNTEAAKLLHKHQTGFLRSHSKPDQDKLDSLTQINPTLQFLAYSSATYVQSNHPDPSHYGLQAQHYTHATSPIRRYADLVNQRSLKAIINKMPVPQLESPNHLNHVAKQAKRHDRDLTFILALQNVEKSELINGQILQIQNKANEPTITKLSIYVPQWQLTVKLHYTTGPNPNTIISKDEKTTHTIALGQQVKLNYHADMTARNWKKRMVIRLTAP
jgi:exoribonuclease R